MDGWRNNSQDCFMFRIGMIWRGVSFLELSLIGKYYDDGLLFSHAFTAVYVAFVAWLHGEVVPEIK